MDGILTGLGLMGMCGVGILTGLVMGFAAVRSAGYRLLYADHRWQVRRLPSKVQPPTQGGTLRSLN